MGDCKLEFKKSESIDILMYSTEEGDVTIRFKDKKFESCLFPFKGPYTRDQWTLLHEISEEIEVIEGIVGNKASTQEELCPELDPEDKVPLDQLPGLILE